MAGLAPAQPPSPPATAAAPASNGNGIYYGPGFGAAAVSLSAYSYVYIALAILALVIFLLCLMRWLYVYRLWRAYPPQNPQVTMTRHNQAALPEDKPAEAASTIREVVVFSHPDGAQSVAIVRDPSGTLPESSARSSHEATEWALHREPAMQHPLQIVIDGGSSSQGDSLHQSTERMSR
jgi:hypothetical protein